MKSTRRDLLTAAGAGFGLAGMGMQSAAGQQPPQHKGKPLDIADYQPKSMLQVPEHKAERARYPVIDVHTHLTWGGSTPETIRTIVPPEELLAGMDRRNIHT